MLGCALYFAALIGVLLPAAIALLVLGYALLALTLAKGRAREAMRRQGLAIDAVFVVWLALTLVSMLGYRLIHYDNYSHWAMTVKYLYAYNALPDASAIITDFVNYPPGASCWLYFVCRVVGPSDGVMIAGQALLIFACFYAMFGVFRDAKRFLLAAVLALGCALMEQFNISIRVNNLLVDFLLPTFALAAISCMIACRRDFRLACLSCAPVLAMLCLLKTTGVVFVLPCLIVLIRLDREKRESTSWRKAGERALLTLGVLAAVAVPFALWQAHVSATFPAGASKFALDASGLRALGADRTSGQIREIRTKFLNTLPYLSAVRGWALMNLLALLTWLNARFGFDKRGWRLPIVLAWLDAFVALYYIGLLIFYAYIMSLQEALILAGLERYALSMTVFFVGALFLCLVDDVERSFHVRQGAHHDYRAFKSLRSKQAYQITAALCVIAAAIFLFTDFRSMNEQESAFEQELPSRAEGLLGNNWDRMSQRRYLVYESDQAQETNDYDVNLEYVCRYLLFDLQVDAVTSADAAALSQQIPAYDSFVIVQSDPEIRAYMEQYAGLPGDAGVYETEGLLKYDAEKGEGTP